MDTGSSNLPQGGPK